MGAEENELVVVSGRAKGCFSLRAFFLFLKAAHQPKTCHHQKKCVTFHTTDTAEQMHSRNIILHLLCFYFKHRKVTICPPIAELRPPVPRPPPHRESFLFVWLDFQLCEKCVLGRAGESR